MKAVESSSSDTAVCQISALSYHDITTQIPSSVHLAVPRGSYHGIKLSMPVTVYRGFADRIAVSVRHGPL